MTEPNSHAADLPGSHEHHANGHSKLHDEERFHRLEQTVTAHGHALQTAQPAFPTDKIHRRLALPIPLAAYSIGATTWLLGLLLLNARHTTLPNAWIINGLPMGFGLTLLAGIGEIFTGNTFGCALFLSVAAIVLGLAQPFLPWSSIASAFVVANNGQVPLALEQINYASGVFLFIAWAILFILMIAAQRTAIAIVTSLVFIQVAAITFGVGLIEANKAAVTTTGAFLIITSINLFYNGTALLLLEVGHPLAKFFPLGMLAPAPPKDNPA